MHNRAYCWVTCNRQSKWSVHACLHEYVKARSWNLCTLSFRHQCLSWLGPPLLWGVLSVLSSINMFLPQVRPQFILCVFTKNWGPQGRLLFYSPYLVNKKNLRPIVASVQRRQWHPTPVLWPGKSHGRRSLVGCGPWGQRVGHDWVTSLSLFTFMHWRRKWQPTPVFLPRESQGRGSLVGCRLWGWIESDMTEVT